MRIALGISLLTAALATAAVALAAPARNHTFAASGSHTWSAAGSGLIFFSDGTIPVEECTTGLRDCDDTLIQLTVPGTLTAKVTGGAATQADVAIDLFESDASGAAGKQLGKGDGSTPTIVEQVSKELDPGYYVVRIDFLLGFGDVDVAADFAVAEVPPAAPPAGANAAPKATPKITKKIKASKLKGLGGTATDDGAVAKVEVGLLQKKRGKCEQLTGSGSLKAVKSCKAPTTFLAAAGTTSWSLKLKKKLPKGSYTVFARATDDKGLVQVAPSKASFTVS